MLIGKSEIVNFSEKIKAVNAAHGYFVAKQRNKHLQTTLIEAAKMAPRYSPDLAMLYAQGKAERQCESRNAKLVAYLMAVDRGQRNFQVMETSNCIAGRTANKKDLFGA